MHGLSTNYKPSNSLAPKPASTPIPDSLKQKAKMQGCEYISKDGQNGYCWRYDKMLVSHAPDFESWEPVFGPELPAGELEKL